MRLPFANAKLAYAAFVEWGKYMSEMYQSKQTDIRNGKSDDGMDLMGTSCHTQITNLAFAYSKNAPKQAHLSKAQA